MDDREIRHQAQKRGWWYAAAIVSGPAHIIKDNGRAVCEEHLAYSTRLHVRARKLCKKCRVKAENIFEGEKHA